MKQNEQVYREILYQALEMKNYQLTQATLARTLGISLNTINKAVHKIHDIGAVELKPRGFIVLDPKKILYFWASHRSLQKDIFYVTRVESSVLNIEKLMPDTIVFGAYSAYRFRFASPPADYSEVYVYADENIKKRFPLRGGPPNLFIIKQDLNLNKYGKTTTLAQTFVDLWNLREWYSKDFVKALEVKIDGILE